MFDGLEVIAKIVSVKFDRLKKKEKKRKNNFQIGALL